MATKHTSGMSGLANMVIATLLLLFGATMVGGFSLEVSSGKHPFTAGDAVMMLLFGLAPLVVGAGWLVRQIRGRRRAATEDVERTVLTCAMQHGGVVTAMQVAAETALSFHEAKHYLDGLADQGDVEVVPSDAGLAYRFPGCDSRPAAAAPRPFPAAPESAPPPRESA